MPEQSGTQNIRIGAGRLALPAGRSNVHIGGSERAEKTWPDDAA
jgi:hypothetical protein